MMPTTLKDLDTVPHGVTLVWNALGLTAAVLIMYLAYQWTTVQIDLIKTEAVVNARAAETEHLKAQVAYAKIKMQQTGCEQVELQ